MSALEVHSKDWYIAFIAPQTRPSFFAFTARPTFSTARSFKISITRNTFEKLHTYKEMRPKISVRSLCGHPILFAFLSPGVVLPRRFVCIALGLCGKG